MKFIIAIDSYVCASIYNTVYDSSKSILNTLYIKFHLMVYNNTGIKWKKKIHMQYKWYYLICSF